ncbi:hypothetical protein ABK040_014199 [Willaertia magna]
MNTQPPEERSNNNTIVIHLSNHPISSHLTTLFNNPTYSDFKFNLHFYPEIPSSPTNNNGSGQLGLDTNYFSPSISKSFQSDMVNSNNNTTNGNAKTAASFSSGNPEDCKTLTLFAHKLVLSQSSFFKALFNSFMKETITNQMDLTSKEENLNLFCKMIYSLYGLEKLQLKDFEELIEFLFLLDKYEFHSVCKVVMNEIINQLKYKSNQPSQREQLEEDFKVKQIHSLWIWYMFGIENEQSQNIEGSNQNDYKLEFLKEIQEVIKDYYIQPIFSVKDNKGNNNLMAGTNVTRNRRIPVGYIPPPPTRIIPIFGGFNVQNNINRAQGRVNMDDEIVKERKLELFEFTNQLTVNCFKKFISCFISNNCSFEVATEMLIEWFSKEEGKKTYAAELLLLIQERTSNKGCK